MDNTTEQIETKSPAQNQAQNQAQIPAQVSAQIETQIETQTQALQRLTQEVERLNTHRFVTLHNSIWRLMFFQLTRGLAFGLGSVLGATILVSLLGWWVAQIEFIPIIGEWAHRIMEQVELAK